MVLKKSAAGFCSGGTQHAMRATGASVNKGSGLLLKKGNKKSNSGQK
jgi:hypothetical protein